MGGYQPAMAMGYVQVIKNLNHSNVTMCPLLLPSIQYRILDQGPGEEGQCQAICKNHLEALPSKLQEATQDFVKLWGYDQFPESRKNLRVGFAKH